MDLGRSDMDFRGNRKIDVSPERLAKLRRLWGALTPSGVFAVRQIRGVAPKFHFCPIEIGFAIFWGHPSDIGAGFSNES